ncbi:hypothetical protein [Salinigranum marinum]|nr:hypothetical protein [Salinigranum marinum]
MSRILSIVSRIAPRPVPRRCRANAWASVYAEMYDVEPRPDGGEE